MKVADLQQHLSDLGRLLDSSGAKSVARELEALSAGLQPFRDQTLKMFADSLATANSASRDDGATSTKRPARGSKPAAADVDPITGEVRDLYERAASPSVSVEQIEAACARLGGLPKARVISVADALGLKGLKSKPIVAITTAIRQRILDRKGATVRASLVDRPASPVTPGPDAPATRSEFPAPAAQ